MFSETASVPHSVRMVALPTVEENRRIWDTYDWGRRGEEWSQKWGGTDSEWWGTILPRLHSFVPTETILEIGPGFGRWTLYLKDLCQSLILVDLSERCIQACKEQFGSHPRISFHVTDGKSLEMVPDGSIDLVFSFDSLVHAEADIIKAYVTQLSSKLTKNGVGFIHHSNLGEYSHYFAFAKYVRGGLRSLLGRSLSAATTSVLEHAGLFERDHWRAVDMTAERFRLFVEEAGLSCISQESVNWTTGKRLIDCISVFTPKCSVWDRTSRVLRNRDFAKEAESMSRVSRLYTFPPNQT